MHKKESKASFQSFYKNYKIVNCFFKLPFITPSLIRFFSRTPKTSFHLHNLPSFPPTPIPRFGLLQVHLRILEERVRFISGYKITYKVFEDTLEYLKKQKLVESAKIKHFPDPK